jgi:hypothetical protein
MLKGIMILALFLGLFNSASASHYRYGSISWTRVSSSTKAVKFKVSQGWRLSAFGGVTLGGTITNDVLYFGDGSYAYITLTVTSINSTDDWFYGEATISHTYTSAGPFTAYYEGCCRYGFMVNNSNGSYRAETTVDLNYVNSSPVISVPPIINMPQGVSNATYNISASDADGDALTFSLASSTETDGTNPSNVSMSSSGTLTMNTSTATIGSLYSVAVKAKDGSSKTISDFIVKIVKATTPPTWDYSITPADNYSYAVGPGTKVSFNLSATGSGTGNTVVLSGTGVPAGATFSTTSGNPGKGTFTWTPTSSDLGTAVIAFTATDANGAQAKTTVSITVSMKPQFDVPPTPSNAAELIYKPGDKISFDVQASVADKTDNATIYKVESQTGTGSYGSLFSNATFATPTTSGNPTKGTFTWATASSDWGLFNVRFSAENSHSDVNTYTLAFILNTPPTFTSTPVTSVNVGQTYSYTVKISDPDITYGDNVDLLAYNMPSWMSFTDNGDGTGTFSGTPGLSDYGTASFSVQAEDAYHHTNPGGIPTQNISLTVNPCNLKLADTHTDEGCVGSKGGSIDLTITGANGTSDVYWTGPDNFTATTEDISGLEAGTYNASVKDAFGCTATYSVTLTSLPLPTVSLDNFGTVCPNANFTLSGGAPSGGSYSGDGVSNGVFDAKTAGNGKHTITYTYTNSNGCTNTATATINVEDATAPVVVTKSAVVYLDANGSASISTSDINNGSSDNCSISSISLDKTAFSCSDLGDNTVTLTVTDGSNNSSTGTATVTVKDAIAPTVITKKISVTLNGSTGSVSIQPSDVDNGSYDNCSFSLSLSQSSFDCSNVGNNTVTLTATDKSGNSSSATAVVTVKTTLSASASTSAQTVYYGYSPMASATLKGSATGGSGSYSYKWNTGATTQSITVSPTTTTTYSVTVTDGNGCTSVAKVEVDVTDVRCGQKMDKVMVCHNGNTICVDASAVPAHLNNHGDYLGTCMNKVTSIFDVPEETVLNAYPNPFSSVTNLTFSLPQDGQALLEVYDLRGVKIATLFNGMAESGSQYRFSFDASSLASGMYMARLVTGDDVKLVKIELEN